MANRATSEPRVSTDAETAPLLQQSNGYREEEDEQEQQDHGLWPAWLFRNGKLSSLEQVLLGASLALFILAAVFIGLFAGQKHINDQRRSHHHHRHKHAPSVSITSTVTASSSAGPVPTKVPSKNDDVCLTPSCIMDAADILQSLDTSVDPCEDFYGFVNNGWLTKNPVPEDKALFGAAQSIDLKNKRIMSTILNSPIDSKYEEADKTNIKHLKAYYAACLDEDNLDRIGSQPLLDILAPIMHLWRGESAVEEQSTEQSGLVEQMKFPWDWIPAPTPTNLPDNPEKKPKEKKPRNPVARKQRLTDTLLFMHSRGIPSLWENYVAGDVGEAPSILKIWIAQSELGLPDRSYYKDEETLAVYQESIRSSLVNVYKSLDETVLDFQDIDTQKTSQKPLESLAEKVVDFEKLLAKYSWDVADVEDPTITYNPYPIKNFTHLTNEIVNFKDYYSGFSPRPGFPDPLIVATPSYFGNLTHVVEKTSDEVLEAYFLWRTALNFGLLLGPRETIRKEVTRLNSFLAGIDEGVRPRREDSCLQSVQDNLGFLIGRYYVMSAFGGDSKAYAEDIIEAVINSFYKRLPQLNWLDPKTRQLAQEKAEAIHHKIGFPLTPNTTDATSMLNYYAPHEPFDPSSHFGNVLRANLASQRRMWNKVNRERDGGEWEMIPSEVNAYYSPEANEIAFPAGILQPPYFSVSMPEYIAFGSFGCVAGHELSHAFDKAGRLFDKNGKLFDWWTNDTTIEFNRLQKCIEDQYGEYFIEDANGKKYYINSRLTGGEDLADAGGISQAFDAWKRRMESDVNGTKYDNYRLPGLDYTREQLFFIAYARGWVRGIKPQEAVRRIRTDPHSPTQFRVLGPLSNEEEFSKAFNCKVGSRYNPEKKCRVW